MDKSLKKLGLYWRTLRHLKTKQVVYRIKKSIFPIRVLPTSHILRSSFQPKVAWPEKKESILSDAEFTFLNDTRRLDFPYDWRNKDIPLLWTYNLHYFDGLSASTTDYHLKLRHVNRWIEDNTDMSSVAWDPYPTSL